MCWTTQGKNFGHFIYHLSYLTYGTDEGVSKASFQSFAQNAKILLVCFSSVQAFVCQRAFAYTEANMPTMRVLSCT